MRVRYYGTVGLPTGYGDAANEFCMAMVTAGIDLEILTPGKELHTDYAELAPYIRSDGNPPTPDPDVVIVHNLPLSCRKTLEAANVVAGCPRALLVAYTTWEGLKAPPELIESLEIFDQVWVPSHVTARALPVMPTFVIPHATDDRPFRSRMADAPEDRCYRFYTVGAWTARKNPEGVVRAYLRAFDVDDNVELWIHSCGASPAAAAMAAVAATGRQPDQLPPIRFSTERLSSEQIQQIHEHCDCFVTASRGESWNIPAFDAMRAGSFIIGTAAIGHREFLDDTNWWALDSCASPASGEVRLHTSPEGMVTGQYFGGDCLTVRQTWRDPYIADMADAMQQVYLDRRKLEIRRGVDPRDRFGRPVIGALIERVLKEALGHG